MLQNDTIFQTLFFGLDRVFHSFSVLKCVDLNFGFSSAFARLPTYPEKRFEIQFSECSFIFVTFFLNNVYFDEEISALTNFVKFFC